MFRGLIGPLAILLTGPALALAQSGPPPPSAPLSPIPASSLLPGTPESVPMPPPLPGMPPPEPGLEEVPGSGVLGPASTQEGSAYQYLWWVRGEYLMWWVKNGPAPPPLVTSGPATAARPAVLGQPGTDVVIGDRPINYPTSAGGRWTFGSWFDLHQQTGFEVTGFYLGQPTQTVTAASNGTGQPILGRPFFAVGINAQQFPNLRNGPTVDYAAFPNLFAGSVNVTSHSRLWGLDILYVHNLVPWTEYGKGGSCSGVYRLDLLAGMRHLDLLEDLGINQNSNILSGGIANFQGPEVFTPNAILVNDQFTTRNLFYGAAVGARAEFVSGAYFLNLTGKVAVGGTEQTVIANGASTLLQPVGVQPSGAASSPTPTLSRGACWRPRQTSATVPATFSPSCPRWGLTSVTRYTSRSASMPATPSFTGATWFGPAMRSIPW